MTIGRTARRRGAISGAGGEGGEGSGDTGPTSAGTKPMTTPKAKLAGLALIAVLCAGFTLGLTAPAWAGFDEGFAAYQRGD